MTPVDGPIQTLERTLYRTVVDHGVWDMVLGVSLLAIGGSIAAGVPAVGAIAGGAVFPVGYLLTQRAAARVGHVQFRPERVRRLRHARAVVLTAIVALLVGLLLAGPRLHSLVKTGILLATPMSVAAYLFEIARFHAYAAAILLAVAGVLLGGARWELALILPGTAILACGLVVLVRFLRRYPGATETSHG